MFLPIAIFLGRLFRSYEDRNISPREGRGRRLLYDLPILLQPLIFMTLIILPVFLKNMKLGKYLENYHIEKWWWLLILPILFQVMMTFLPALIRQRWGRGWFPTITILSALFLISIHFPIAQFLTPYRSAYPVSKAIHALLPPNQELFQYRMSLYGIDFYNKIRTPLVEVRGELEFGFIHLPPNEFSHYYLSSEKFYQRCKENGNVYCVTRHRENVEELRRRVSTLKVLWDNGEFYLVLLRS
jgi:hypothetical protein